jgi:hypothetical protein
MKCDYTHLNHHSLVPQKEVVTKGMKKVLLYLIYKFITSVCDGARVRHIRARRYSESGISCSQSVGKAIGGN